MTNFVLFGLSRAGVSIAHVLMAQGLECLGVWTINPKREGRPSPAQLGLRLLSWADWQQTDADLLLLAPGDHAMEGLVEKIRNSPNRDSATQNRCAVHLSGSLSKDILLPLEEELGYGRAAIHPLRAFAEHETDGKSLRGIFCGLEVGSAETDALRTLFESAGGQVLDIPSHSKRAYHGSAAMATNLLIALLHSAERNLALSAPKIENPRDVIASLAQSSLDAYRKKGAREALTGPVERQDIETVQAHLEAFTAKNPGLEVYRALSLAALELAKQKAGGETVALEAIRSCLTPQSSQDNS